MKEKFDSASMSSVSTDTQESLSEGGGSVTAGPSDSKAREEIRPRSASASLVPDLSSNEVHRLSAAGGKQTTTLSASSDYPSVPACTSIVSEFSKLSPCDRLSTAVALLGACHPLELRLLTSVIDGHNEQHAGGLANMESLANNAKWIETLTKDHGVTAAVHRLHEYIPLLHRGNFHVSKIMTELLHEFDWHQAEPSAMAKPGEASGLCPYCELAFHMALLHPAFLPVKAKVEQALHNLQRDKHRRVLLDSSSDSGVSSNIPELEQDGATAVRLDSTDSDPPQTSQSASTQLASSSAESSRRNSTGDIDATTSSIVSTIFRNIRRDGKKDFAYDIEVTWRSGVVTRCLRTYDHFFDLQCRLLDEFPDTAQKNKRILPFLPGKKLISSAFKKSKAELAEERAPALQKYASDLISLPERISKCATVIEFFQSCPTCGGFTKQCEAGCVHVAKAKPRSAAQQELKPAPEDLSTDASTNAAAQTRPQALHQPMPVASPSQPRPAPSAPGSPYMASSTLPVQQAMAWQSAQYGMSHMPFGYQQPAGPATPYAIAIPGAAQPFVPAYGAPAPFHPYAGVATPAAVPGFQMMAGTMMQPSRQAVFGFEDSIRRAPSTSSLPHLLKFGEYPPSPRMRRDSSASVQSISSVSSGTAPNMLRNASSHSEDDFAEATSRTTEESVEPSKPKSAALETGQGHRAKRGSSPLTVTSHSKRAAEPDRKTEQHRQSGAADQKQHTGLAVAKETVESRQGLAGETKEGHGQLSTMDGNREAVADSEMTSTAQDKAANAATTEAATRRRSSCVVCLTCSHTDHDALECNEVVKESTLRGVLEELKLPSDIPDDMLRACIRRYAWLKRYRLHKYASMLVKMDSGDISSKTEDDLVSRGLTKGASRKLLSHITSSPPWP